MYSFIEHTLIPSSSIVSIRGVGSYSPFLYANNCDRSKGGWPSVNISAKAHLQNKNNTMIVMNSFIRGLKKTKYLLLIFIFSFTQRKKYPWLGSTLLFLYDLRTAIADYLALWKFLQNCKNSIYIKSHRFTQKQG